MKSSERLSRKQPKKVVKVTFFPKQLPIFDCTKRYVVYVKGRRAGGTHGAVNRLVEIAFRSPQSRHLWVDTIHRNIGRYVRRYFMRGIAHTGASYNSQLHVLNFPNGSYCDFGSAERPENLESNT